MKSISKLPRKLNCEADASAEVNALVRHEPNLNWPLQQTAKRPAAMASGMVSLGCAWATETSGQAKRGAWSWSLMALIVTALFVAGCTTSKSGAAAPRSGDGIREYRRLVLALCKDVAALRESAQAVSAASTTKAPVAYQRFDVSLHRLEVFSIKARARADALEKRGEAYFEEWADEISESSDPATREKARARFGELRKDFEAVLNDSRQARQEFRSFLDESRTARSTLGLEPTATALEQARPTFVRIATAGRQTESVLTQLAKTLKAAEEAVMSGTVPAVKTGDKS